MLFPSRETLKSDQGFAKFYAELKANPMFKTLVGSVHEAITHGVFVTGEACDEIEARAMSDVRHEVAMNMTNLFLNFDEVTPEATGQSGIPGMDLNDDE